MSLKRLDDSENLDIFTKGFFSTTAYVHNTRIVQAPSEITGIFDIRSEDMFEPGQVAEGKKITLKVQTLEAKYLSQTDQLSIKGVNYQITSKEFLHDGKLVDLVLKEAEFVTVIDDDDLVDVEVDNLIAGENLSQFRILYLRDDDKHYLADATDINKVYVKGLVEQNVLEDGSGTIRYAGYVLNDSWSFDINKGIFLGELGNIVQEPVTNAVALVRLGSVLSPTEILLDIEDPIFLS